MSVQYDYLIVGAGLFGSVFAYHAVKRGKRCLVVDKRSHIGGNAFTEPVDGIQVHRYGAHIFHTSDEAVWSFINQFAKFNRFINSPIANYKGEIFNLPFNMNTFNKLWGVVTPEQAQAKIQEQTSKYRSAHPRNLEEQAVCLFGEDIYFKLIKGYTEKQWGRSCKELPAFIIRRLPVRFTYDNNYYNDIYQGVPVGGYTAIVEKLLRGCDIELNRDYLSCREALDGIANRVLFTGSIDAFYKYRYGALAYRSLNFETETLNIPNFQGVAVVNYTDADIPYTRIIEHKHFDFCGLPATVITKEFPVERAVNLEPYYPINDEPNQAIYLRYAQLAAAEKKFIFGGRLAEYKYYDMDKTVRSSLELCKKERLI